MALYDNSHWLLSHIRDSFISTDDTGRTDDVNDEGMCEAVMARDDIPKALLNTGIVFAYPGAEDSDDEEPLGDSYDLHFDLEFSHRQRTNTAQRLEKMDQEKKRAAQIKHIKWEYNPNRVSLEEQQELFKSKDLKKDKSKETKTRSLFSEQLQNSLHIPKNPFVKYAQFDGSTQVGLPVRKYKIFMCILPEDQRSYPLPITILATAKVNECIGFICYKYLNEHPGTQIQEDISKYGLYIAEDDGEVDRDFPCLDPSEVISKFEFPLLGLIEMKESDRERHKTVKVIAETKPLEESIEKQDEDQAKALAAMQSHTTALEAPLYQLYRNVYIINKVRAKTEVHLGISGEKIEIDPVVTGKGASRFWHRQRAVSHNMNNVAWCEMVENKGPKSTFTLIYTTYTSMIIDGLNVHISHTQSLRRSASFKTYEFEAESSVAEEIVRKINHILEMRSSASRKEYLAQKQRKASRRKSFHIHR